MGLRSWWIAVSVSRCSRITRRPGRRVSRCARYRFRIARWFAGSDYCGQEPRSASASLTRLSDKPGRRSAVRSGAPSGDRGLPGCAPKSRRHETTTGVSVCCRRLNLALQQSHSTPSSMRPSSESVTMVPVRSSSLIRCAAREADSSRILPASFRKICYSLTGTRPFRTKHWSLKKPGIDIRPFPSRRECFRVCSSDRGDCLRRSHLEVSIVARGLYGSAPGERHLQRSFVSNKVNAST
jgi:hypothetical protein